MITMFAEALKEGKWYKMGKIFPSALPELEGQLTDRVYDGISRALENALSGESLKRSDILHIYPGVADDTCDEIAAHPSLIGKCVRHVYADNLLAFLVTYCTCKVGYITEWQYKRFTSDGIQPVHIRHNIPKSTGVKVNPMEMDMILNNPDLRREDVKYFVRHEYDRRAFNQDCPFFFDKIAPILAELYNSYDKVRIVYGMKE